MIPKVLSNVLWVEGVLACICMNELWKVHKEPTNSVYSRGGKLGLLEFRNARTT